MADIGASIRTIILADATIAGEVGTRVHSDLIPQGSTLPAISYRVIDTVPTEHLTGVADIFNARIEIDCHARTRGAANTLANLVRVELQQAIRGTFGGVYIYRIGLQTGEQYMTEPIAEGSDQQRYVTSQDFSVFYRPTNS